jgi:sugar phosphate permease
MLFNHEAKLLPSRLSSHRARWSTDSWTWEIFFCFISIIATVAVAIILLIFDEKPLPKLPYGIGVYMLSL